MVRLLNTQQLFRPLQPRLHREGSGLSESRTQETLDLRHPCTHHRYHYCRRGRGRCQERHRKIVGARTHFVFGVSYSVLYNSRSTTARMLPVVYWSLGRAPGKLFELPQRGLLHCSHPTRNCCLSRLFSLTILSVRMRRFCKIDMPFFCN